MIKKAQNTVEQKLKVLKSLKVMEKMFWKVGSLLMPSACIGRIACFSYNFMPVYFCAKFYKIDLKSAVQ